MRKKNAPCKVLNVKELMEQMGFSKHAPASTQEAFIKHLGRVLGQNVVHLEQARKNEYTAKDASETKEVKTEADQLDLFKKAS
jgi:hypothetical protein